MDRPAGSGGHCTAAAGQEPCVAGCGDRDRQMSPASGEGCDPLRFPRAVLHLPASPESSFPLSLGFQLLIAWYSRSSTSQVMNQHFYRVILYLPTFNYSIFS